MRIVIPKDRSIEHSFIQRGSLFAMAGRNFEHGAGASKIEQEVTTPGLRSEALVVVVVVLKPKKRESYMAGCRSDSETQKIHAAKGLF